MHTKFIALALLAGAAVAAPALADNINFGQFGPEGTHYTGPITGLTTDGVGFTLVAPGDIYRSDEGSFWRGEFAHGTPLLFSSANGGQIVIYFDHAISSFNTIAAQANLIGPFTATLNAYSLGTLVNSSTYTGDNQLGPESTIGGFAISGYFDTVTIFTTNAGLGFAIGGVNPPPPIGGVPEPAAWALMIAGFALTGNAMRQRRREVVAA